MKIENIKELLEDIDNGKIKTLKQNSKFKFTCTMCGKCCFNRDIILNIYELVRMRNALGMTTLELFKKDIITTFIGSESGLPLCMIKMSNNCPLLAPVYFSDDIKSEQDIQDIRDLTKKTNHYGCAINKHKPMMCRLFPLGRIIKMDMKKNITTEKFILTKEPDCAEAFKNGKEWTLKEWLDDIEFKHYKAGSANFTNLIKVIDNSGLNANTKTGKLQRNSSLLKILTSMMYDFDNLKIFMNNKIVQKTIKDKKSTHKDFIYVANLVTKYIEDIISLFSTNIKSCEKVATKFLNESRTSH